MWLEKYLPNINALGATRQRRARRRPAVAMKWRHIRDAVPSLARVVFGIAREFSQVDETLLSDKVVRYTGQPVEQNGAGGSRGARDA
jgi:hypothetical protein